MATIVETKNPEISIIVPAHNVAKYLENALDSVIEQSFKDWECIVIDDGSTDGTEKICDEYGKKDSRFKIVHQSASGVSKARNAGLKLMRGNYVAFMDSDDWLDPTYLSTLLGLIKEYDADVVQCGFWKEYKTYTRFKPLVKDNQIKVLDRAQTFVALVEDRELPSYLWNKLYRREVINAPFPEGKVFEDIYVTSQWYRNVNKLVLVPQPLYHYRIRNGSIMNSNYSNNQYHYVVSSVERARTTHELYPKHFPKRDLNEAIYRFAVNGAKSIARREPDTDKRWEYVIKIGKLLQDVKNPGIFKMGFKQWERGHFLKHNPKQFYKLVRISLRTDIHGKYRKKKFFG